MGEAFREPDKALRDELVRGLGEGFRTLIYLDAWVDTTYGKGGGKERPVARLLSEGLLMEDNAREMFFDPGRTQEEVAKLTSHLLGGSDAVEGEAFGSGGSAFVCSQETLAWSDERARSLRQVSHRDHGTLPPSWIS